MPQFPPVARFVAGGVPLGDDVTSGIGDPTACTVVDEDRTGTQPMEATFFTCPREDAIGVSAIDDLPCEPAGEPVRIESTAVLSALARSLCGEGASRVEPLRDATCRSFPVFEFTSNVPRTLAELAEARIDEIAESWLAVASWQGADIDLYETACLLADIRRALRASESPEAMLFVLLEEKAI